MRDDPAFPQIVYRRGASGQLTPALRGTGIRVQSIVVAAHDWGVAVDEIASDYGITEAQVKEALAFYQAHRQEIDSLNAAEEALEKMHENN